MFKTRKSLLNPNTTDTLIGEGTLFEGCIRSEASIRIEGQIIGDVTCNGDVTIGEHGHVRSDITARDVVLAGIVHGNITTSGKLTITSTGTLLGDISAASITIEEGGVFQGTSKMERKQPSLASQGSGDPDKAAKPAPQAGESLKAPAVAISN
ncbi:bactofilin family protein [Paenibacillus hexagrammi]|uniref:Polymer-forming cytoskeletal protein n=1 Tax=Paenibacillus hexagrammi TaxID=2908839 RepID=A0ABY3SJU9_9BACL|nr:polymer-forming cytoskeletal protein [Paenibacillus sp. YPD9-1]UJF34241.1 polymer-forming cytoskeletal protein [Paenibacillus sp. YPD9-1]